ncbi:MAG: pantetheine-phosphate adenylyltransferase [Fluviicola sp. XM-24bin1]|nr:MAG: pantetheine-phosphate adenylyltransferase [Fluviicola sp. XM-24bin1]
MKKIGLFPGSFDPFTKGHEIVVHKSLPLFDEVVIGVGVNSSKTYLFDLDRRMEHINTLFKDVDKVRVEQFQKLTVDFCKDINASHIIRGLRDSKDFQYEKSIAHMNKSISGIETVFFLTDQEYSAINASIIREIHKNGGPIEAFVTNPELLVS